MYIYFFDLNFFFLILKIVFFLLLWLILGQNGGWSCHSPFDGLVACLGNLGVCHYSGTLIGWCA